MHELSIAVNIVEIADQNAKENNINSFSEMELEIGSLSGVVIDALEFALAEAIKNSSLQKTEIKITSIQAMLRCNKCLHEFKSEDYINQCEKCGSFENEAFQGKELKIKSLTT